MNKRWKVCFATISLILSLCTFMLCFAKTRVETDTTETAEVNCTMSEIDSDVPKPESIVVDETELNIETIEEDTYDDVDETVYAICNVNIRKMPSAESEKLGKLIGNESIKRIGYSEEWSIVIYKDNECYIASKYLTTEKPPMPEDVTEGLVYLGEFKITAYCGGSCCNGKWAGTTSTGVAPSEGRTIAVAPWVIPYGSQVYIDGVGYRTAEDTGGFANRNSHQIDLFIASHSRANTWGVQYRNVWIVK